MAISTITRRHLPAGSFCQSPRLYGSAYNCRVCGGLLRDSAEYIRADIAKAENERLREALGSLTQRPTLFLIYHTNIEHGDYLSCRFCGGESRYFATESASVAHKLECEYAAARAALEQKD